MARRSGVLAIAMFICSGCATVAHGVRQEIVVTSEPLGAHVFINDVPAGTTPARVSLKRRERKVIVRVEKEGFATEHIALKRSVSGWMVLDAAVALNPMAAQGLDSASDWPKMAAMSLVYLLGTDLVTGAAYNFPKVVRAALKPEDAR